ncbi:MAG: hypothetical protein J5840_06085, partial [Lachnospiraceae bacterium]|nr:hypothetical protein [Lachnospiraceae bacterium]
MLPNFTVYSSEGKNKFTLWLFGEEMGSVESVEEAEKMVIKAREELAAGQKDLYMIEDLHKEIIAEEAIYKSVDEEEEVYNKILRTLKAHQKETMTRAYMVKVKNTTVNLESADDVNELLSRAIEKYDENDEYEVITEINQERIMSTLTVRLSRKDVEYDDLSFDSGAQNTFGRDIAESEIIEFLDFKDITQGITSIGFAEEVEVAETYI